MRNKSVEFADDLDTDYEKEDSRVISRNLAQAIETIGLPLADTWKCFG